MVALVTRFSCTWCTTFDHVKSKSIVAAVIQAVITQTGLLEHHNTTRACIGVPGRVLLAFLFFHCTPGQCTVTRHVLCLCCESSGNPSIVLCVFEIISSGGTQPHSHAQRHLVGRDLEGVWNHSAVLLYRQRRNISPKEIGSTNTLVFRMACFVFLMSRVVKLICTR